MPELFGFMHVNVNCSDLARSRGFYEDALGLIPTAHTRPGATQPGAGFGLEGDVLWDAWVLDDPRGMGASASLDLLRWETPAPIGMPPGVPPATGIHRLVYAVRSLAEVLPRLAAAGRGTLPPVSVARGDRRTRLAWALDPDGSVIEVVEDPSCAQAVQARAVAVGCRDLESSVAWYASLLGLEVVANEHAAAAPAGSFGAPDAARWDAAVLELPSRPAHYALRLERWHAPALVERPPPVANQLGPFRMAFLVDDAHAWHAALERRGVRCSGPPVWLDTGPEIPIDGLWALFFFDPDGTCVELIQTPDVHA